MQGNSYTELRHFTVCNIIPTNLILMIKAKLIIVIGKLKKNEAAICCMYMYPVPMNSYLMEPPFTVIAYPSHWYISTSFAHHTLKSLCILPCKKLKFNHIQIG